MAVDKKEKGSLGGASVSARSGAGTARRGGGFAGRVMRWPETSVFVAAVALFVYFVFASSYFMTMDNMSVIGQYVAATAIIAAGEVMVIITGEIDLSVGKAYALAPFVMYFAHQGGVPQILAIGLGLLAVMAIGLLNGLITVLLRLPSFVTTLGMLFFVNGVTLTISGGSPVQPASNGLVPLLFGSQGGLDEIIWAFAIAMAFQFLLVKTRWGLHTIATGGNPLGAAEVGVQTGLIKIGNFMLCSTLGGLAGILDAFRIGSIDPLAGGTQIMFMAIASAVIGGTLLTGGSGTVIGALIGAVALGVLKDGLTILGVNAYTFYMILGIAIVATMAMNVSLGRLQFKGGR